MNDTAKKLRDITQSAGVTPGSGKPYSVIAAIKSAFGFDSILAAGVLLQFMAAIADELDELDDKATRRRSHIMKLESTIAERNRELRELRKQVPTERERRILDMWPRFEDREYVWFGDEVACRGKACMLDDVKFVSDGTFHDETYLYVSNGLDVFEVPIAAGERVKRPARSVLDADGVEIKVGDSMYVANNGDGPYTVCNIDESIDRIELFWHENTSAERLFIPANRLTHTRPDSWERLESDAVKGVCEYTGAEPTAFGAHDCDTCRFYGEHGKLICEQLMALDIVRRAKALAGIEVD